MRNALRALALSLTAIASFTLLPATPAHAQNTGPKMTWHWHNHQPIYWNGPNRLGQPHRYEYAWDSIQVKRDGDPYPMNDLDEIFGKDDRVAVYQWRMRDSLESIGSHANSGVTCSYTGALMENVRSLGMANQMGYSPGWKGAMQQAMGWTTPEGARRLDLVNMSFHHGLVALLDTETMYMSIRLHQEIMKQEFGDSSISKGYFPTEMAFTTRMIPVLNRLGIEWTIVSGEKIARACPDYPIELGRGGVNTDPPNRADQINPNGGDFVPVSTDITTPRNANPLSFQPAYARYIDPETGEEHRIIVVPADQGNGYQDGYQCINASFLDEINSRNDPSQPSLVLLAHDGDNAFGGGYSYYMECVPNLANDARNRGYEVTTIQGYLNSFPPSSSAVIHVEDGGWINPTPDFGSPNFHQWLYPLITANGQPDPINGWHYKAREMAIFLESAARLQTAQQILGYTPDFGAILNPTPSSHPIDRAWHFHLGAHDSGNVYYGAALDHEIKGTIGVNEVFDLVDPILEGNLDADVTPPLIFTPQRWPWNPGGLNFGANHQFREYVNNGDFVIWTFVADPSGLESVTLKYRIDNDGTRSLDNIENETYAGGPGVGEWVELEMNGREYPVDNIYNWGDLNYFVLPKHAPDHYSVEISSLRDVLIDYYVEAVDGRGNIARSPIQHVYIGDGEGATGGIGDGGPVTVTPNPPVRGQDVTISYDAANRSLAGAGSIHIHIGTNGWAGGALSPRPALTRVGDTSTWEVTLPVAGDANQLNFVFTTAATGDPGQWDNNGGADWNVNTVEAGDVDPTPTPGPTPDPTPTPAPAPMLEVTPTSISASAVVGSNPGNETMRVRNSGTGTLNYTITWSYEGEPDPVSPVAIANRLLGRTANTIGLDVNGDGVIDAADIIRTLQPSSEMDWLSVTPIIGTLQTGTHQDSTITYNTNSLQIGTYNATIMVSGNAGNSPRTIPVTLTLTDEVIVPGTTTVVPNPPVAGESARVWYNTTAGPISGRSQYNLHWGINGGATGGGGWENVTSTPMVDSGTNGMWYADITIPSTATSLNFVTNDGNDDWDNNSGNNWNFAVVPADAGDPAISLSPTLIQIEADQGEDVGTRTITVTNSGTGNLDFTASVRQPSGGKSTGRGTRKTITIDGQNTGGEWTESELVALDPAFNHANVVGGNWSTHETQMDYTALYAAWDDDNLYVGIQIVDVIDIEDPANAGSSQGTRPTQMDLPQFIAISTGPGGYGAPTPVSDMWGKAHGFAGPDQPNYQVYFASNFWQGPFVAEYTGGWDPDSNAFGPPGQVYTPHPGLQGASAPADAGAPIIGPGGKDYRALGHNTGRNSFFEVQIPLELIGNPDLDNGSIGLFVGHGEGFSGVDTIPVDPAATDLPGTSDSNSPIEWEDTDIYTVPFAQVGGGEGQVNTNWLAVSPTQGSLNEGQSTDLTLTINTADLEPGTHVRLVEVSGNATNSPQVAEVQLTISGEPAPPTIQLNQTSLEGAGTVGGTVDSRTFTVRNSGAGTLEYTIDAIDTGDGTGWLHVSPASGSSSGSANTITVSFDTTGLEAGTHAARLDVSGNASNSPQSISVTLTLQEESLVPSTTTVQPNPPIAGQMARVWYATTAGSIAGRAQYNLHWGINGGATGDGDWENVTSTPLANANEGGMWYADIMIPESATSLNFVFNDGGDSWDNNSGQNWNFAVITASEPVITVSTTTVNATTVEGSNAASSSFAVRNGGAGTLAYTLALVDTGDGTDWLNISPTSGTSSGSPQTINVNYNSTSLTPGLYLAGIEIDGDAMNAPVVVTVRLTVTTEGQTQSPITIGPGPSLGVNTEGMEYFEEFQDWTADDLRALDLNDAVELNDGYDMSRDLVAFYSRFENENLYLRVDLLELGIFAENGFVDVYVLIDTGDGGTTSLPNGLPGTTPAPWNIAVATYDSVNAAVILPNGNLVENAHLGSYWRSDLDAVEFGVRLQALLDAGWDGTSTVDFMVFTAKDMTDNVTDTMGFEIPISSQGTTGRAKFATVAHGNQSFNRGDSMRDRLYISAANTGVGAPSGFHLTLDTHSLFQVPLNIHMSATLIAAIMWIEDGNPVWDGGAFLDRVGSFIDEDQSIDPGAKIGGVFAEHIMPFFVGEVNLNSIELFDDLARDLWGIDGNDMKIMHTPERVANAVDSSVGRDLFDDINDSAYIATYLDEVAHIRDWLYPDDPWTGIGGEYGVPRQHKIHLLNGVYTFLINDQEDHYKFWPQDGGANMNWRLNLLWKALDTDQEQLTLIFDDWEALAGYSFGSGYNDNAIQYNDVIRWVANKPWIEVVTLKEILDRATNPSNPQYSSNWVIDQGDLGNQPMMTYDWLQHATGDSYENWYFGSALEESFRDTVPVISGTVGNGEPLPSGKIFGELGTPGTIIHDTWEAVCNAPDNNLRRLAEMAYQAMIYETAWHDSDNTNYARDPNTNHTTWLFPDTTFDRIAGWALQLHNHLRGVTITTTAAAWAESVRNGSRPAGVTVQAVDLDQDGLPEYVLSNERVWMAFEARGGRCVQAYYYDPAIQDAISFLGTSPINNPSAQGEEELTTFASRCSGFKEMNDDAYADVIYSVELGSSSLTFTSPDGLISKTISLAPASTTVTANYTNSLGGDLYTRMGISVNNLDLFVNGQNFTSSYSTSTFSQVNNTRGSVTIEAGTGAQINQIDLFTRFVIPLTEQMELRLSPGASSFTINLPN